MVALTVPLALGCVLLFSHVDTAITELYGEVPDGVYYKTVTLKDAQGRHRVLEAARPGKGFSAGPAFKVGPSPDLLFASYLVSEKVARRNVQDVRFVSARSCGPIRFVRARDGAMLGAEDYRGWLPESPHSVRVWRDGQSFEPGLPLDEAQRANPAIRE